MGKVHVPGNVLVMFDGNNGEVNDGFHSFNELYAHRCSLFAALVLATDKPSWRSWKNSDGKGPDGWFVVGMEVSEGVMITYHLPAHMWGWFDETRVETLDAAPSWDGHTSLDVIRRLGTWCETMGGKKPDESAVREAPPLPEGAKKKSKTKEATADGPKKD